MSSDAALILLVIAVLALILSASRRTSETLQPPQIVYVQAEAPQSSGVAWVLVVILTYLLLKALGVA